MAALSDVSANQTEPQSGDAATSDQNANSSNSDNRNDPNAPPESVMPDNAAPDDPNELGGESDPDLNSVDQDNQDNIEYDSMFPDAEDMVLLFEYYDRIFNEEYISETGQVDYATLRRKRIDLIRAANVLERLHPAVLMSLNEQQRIAFWINTYNACTLKLVIDNYPIQAKWYMILYPSNSIMQISGAWTRVFFRIMGLEYNLREIRNDLLLDRYEDPRISFALTHAAQGGAILRNEPYLPETLDEQLDDQVRRFLESPNGMRIDESNNVLYLSNVFAMNKNAFLSCKYAEVLRFRARKPEERAWLNFLLDHLPEKEATWLRNNDPEIRFLDFDWTLNEQ